MSQLEFVLSTTHHTFLVGPWENAGAGAVRVTQLDDPECIVLILKPDDVQPLLDAIRVAASMPVPQVVATIAAAVRETGCAIAVSAE